MEYYKISQDKKLQRIIDIPTKYLKDLDAAFEKDGNPIVIYYEERKEDRDLDYVEVEKHVLVSDRLKKLFSKYEREINFKMIFLINLNKGNRKQYWMMDVPFANCLSDQTEFYPDGTIKSMVIDGQSVKERCIFSVKNGSSHYFKNQMIINLDVAESILRRNIVGICYEKLLCE